MGEALHATIGERLGVVLAMPERAADQRVEKPESAPAGISIEARVTELAFRIDEMDIRVLGVESEQGSIKVAFGSLSARMSERDGAQARQLALIHERLDEQMGAFRELTKTLLSYIKRAERDERAERRGRS
jgi:hypothetical protein